MDPATAALAFATAIAQVTVASFKLKKLWAQISDTPEDVRHLIDNLETVEVLLAEMDALRSQSGWQNDPSMVRCQRLCTTAHKELEASARELETKLHKRGRLGRKVVGVMAAWRRDAVENQEKRLEKAMTLLFFAHQIACSRHMAHSVSIEVARRLQIGVIPKMVSPGQSLLDLPSIDAESEDSSPARSDGVLVNEHKASIQFPRVQKSRNATIHQGWVKRLRFPTWWFGVVYELQSIPQLSSYVFRVYNTVSSDSRVIRSIQFGDVTEFRNLLESKQASPYDVDSDDWSLLHYAVWCIQPEICEILLQVSGRDNLANLAEEGSRMQIWGIARFFRLNAQKDDANFAKLAELFNGYLLGAEVTLRALLFLPDEISLLGDQRGALRTLTTDLNPNDYILPARQRLSNVRLAAAVGCECAFVRSLLSHDGNITRELLQVSNTTGLSLLRSAAMGLGSIFANHLTRICRLQSLRAAITSQTTPWTVWIGEMARLCTPRDLHVLNSLLTIDRPWLVTPLQTVLITGFWWIRFIVKRSLWDTAIQMILHQWLYGLQAGGVELLEYGRAECLAFETLGSLQLFCGHLLASTLSGIAYGAEPEDWKLIWALELEEAACEFWEMVEKPGEVMPGSWIEE